MDERAPITELRDLLEAYEHARRAVKESKRSMFHAQEAVKLIAGTESESIKFQFLHVRSILEDLDVRIHCIILRQLEDKDDKQND